LPVFSGTFLPALQEQTCHFGRGSIGFAPKHGWIDTSERRQSFGVPIPFRFPSKSAKSRELSRREVHPLIDAEDLSLKMTPLSNRKNQSGCNTFIHGIDGYSLTIY
jgi:hypothetical protein